MITPSASTLGAPGVPIDVVLNWLQQHRIPGIELRLAPGEAADPGMGRSKRRELREKITSAAVTVTGIASYVRVAAPGPDAAVIEELISAIEFACDLGAPMVRVFPGADVEPAAFTKSPTLLGCKDEVDVQAARRLSAVTSYAAECRVLPVLETHDSHPSGQDIAGILRQVEGPVGVVWDLMHPWRVGEQLEQTWTALRPWLSVGLGSVQVKDAGMPVSSSPVPIGEGSLPTAEFAEMLIHNGYQGPVTLEWEKAWYPEAAQMDVALASVRTWIDKHWDEDSK